MKRTYGELYNTYIKRCLDCSFALLLVLTAPLMGTCALAIKAENPSGRIIFCQERNGKDGKVFRIYKFRTMREALCSGLEKPLPATLSHPGKAMRLLSLDELPQLVNILKGEMSFVGPRPLPTGYYPYFNEKELARFTVLPGITGLAQVKGRALLDWEKRFELDVFYIENQSWRLDIWIVFATVGRLFVHDDVMVMDGDQLDFNEYRMKEWGNEACMSSER